MKRRDLMEASRLLQRHGLAKPGEMDPASLMMAASYLAERRDGETELGFLEWLDEDVNDDDLPDGDDGPLDLEPPVVPTKKAAAKKAPAKKATARR